MADTSIQSEITVSSDFVIAKDFKIDGDIYTKDEVSQTYKKLDLQADLDFKAFIARMPAYYNRPNLPTSNHTTITIPANTQVNIDNAGYVSTDDKTLDISTLGDASSRAGKDFYIYAVTTSAGELDFVLSANSTVPDTYNADNSRKIGGFHCLCLATGDLGESHPLSNYATGDVLPRSIWDLNHRPDCKYPEGKVYNPGAKIWSSIYLLTWEGTGTSQILKSTFGGVTADGTSKEKFDWYKFAYVLAKQGERMPTQREFINLSLGSNQNTVIQGASDPNTTGGHTDTTGRRMISYDGNEDCCGVLWQWSEEPGGANGADWAGLNDTIFPTIYPDEIDGDTYYQSRRGLFGGACGLGSRCGSLCSNWNNSGSNLNWNIAARSVAPCLPVFNMYGLFQS